MRSALFVRPFSLILAVTLASPALAVHRTEDLLPATTKGYISTDDVDEVREKFNETQLGAMVNDPLMEPFIADFKKQIGAKMEKAGKKLGIRWDDLEGVYGGEVAAALIQPNPKDKNSHATVVIVDVTGKQKEIDVLLAKIEANQKAQRAVKSQVQAGSVVLTVYTQPLAAGQKVADKSYYFIKDDQLVLADHLETITAIAGRFAGGAKDSLAGVEAFRYSMDRNAKEAGDMEFHVRWFVEPFGYAEASRAAQGGRKKRGTDMLKVLQGQGFPAVQGLGGYVFFATESEEVLHRTYIYAPPVKRAPDAAGKDKYDLAARMLDFPNGRNLDVQSWVLNDLGGYLTFNWKMQDAFKYSETLVDAIAGDKGVFDEIWLSLKNDPNGPKIDIFGGLVDHLEERATMFVDVAIPVNEKSERLMTLVAVKNPKIVAETVEKAFKNDPAAKKRVFKGQVIWEIQEQESLAEDEVEELMIEGAGFVSAENEEAEEEEEKPILPNMAITVFEGHLIVSTHVSFIEDLVSRFKDGNGLGNENDFIRVKASLEARGMGLDSFRYFTRTDESYRATYELLKQNKLPQSETMLARILNGMLGPEEEGAVRKQEIDGSKLPDFDAMKKYMGPGGLFVQSEDDGWYAVGVLLKK
jgi:hypothetical protein